MLLFFDIFHNGELHLDEDGEEFASLEHAHNHLDTLRKFIRLGGHRSNFASSDAAIDITAAMSVALLCCAASWRSLQFHSSARPSH